MRQLLWLWQDLPEVLADCSLLMMMMICILQVNSGAESSLVDDLHPTNTTSVCRFISLFLHIYRSQYEELLVSTSAKHLEGFTWFGC